MTLPSTFTRSSVKKKGHHELPSLVEMETFSTSYGTFPRRNEPDSPTEIKMKRTAILFN